MLFSLLISSAIALATPTPDADLRCGLGWAETGNWDPLIEECRQHDLEFNKEKDGQPNDGFAAATVNFIGHGIGTTIQDVGRALLASVELPLYSILIIGVGGPLWILHRLNRNDDTSD